MLDFAHFWLGRGGGHTISRYWTCKVFKLVGRRGDAWLRRKTTEIQIFNYAIFVLQIFNSKERSPLSPSRKLRLFPFNAITVIYIYDNRIG